MREAFTRREVLKAVGVAGGLTGCGAADAGTTAVGTTRFVEVGISYDLKAGTRVPTGHRETEPDYRFDPDRRRIVLPDRVPETAVERFRGGFAVAANDGLEPGPRDVEPVRGRRVVISVDGGRPLGSVSLTAPHEQPTVALERRGRRAVLLTEEGDYELRESDTLAVELPPRTLRVRGLEYADEVPEGTGARRGELTAPPEPIAVEVEATPTVSVADHGEIGVSQFE